MTLNIFYYNNQKVTSNKFTLEIFNSPFYYNNQKKKQVMNLR